MGGFFVNLQESIGKNLNCILGEKNMTTEELSKKVNIKEVNVLKVINGQKFLNFRELNQIASVLKVDVSELLKEDKENMLLESNCFDFLDKIANGKSDFDFLVFIVEEILHMESKVCSLEQ